MDKRLFIQVQGGRKVSGVLRGFDIFLNIVLDDSLDESVAGQKSPMGQIVRSGDHSLWKRTVIQSSILTHFIR